MFPWESPWEIFRAIKCHSCRSRAHLAVSTEQVSFQTNESCLCKSISPFTMGLYGSPYDYVIHVAIIASSRVPLITSFQPPLCSIHSIKKVLIALATSLQSVKSPFSIRSSHIDGLPHCPNILLISVHSFLGCFLDCRTILSRYSCLLFLSCVVSYIIPHHSVFYPCLFIFSSPSSTVGS